MGGASPAMTIKLFSDRLCQEHDRAQRQRGGGKPDRGEIDPVIGQRAAQRARHQRRPQQQPLIVTVLPRNHVPASEAMILCNDYAATRCAAMIWSAARPVTSAMRSNCLVKLPAPAVAERNSTIRSPISASGMVARAPAHPAPPLGVSKPRIWPRRADRMALIFAVASVGQKISTMWIGSKSTGWHCGSASLMPPRAAVRKARSEESTL